MKNILVVVFILLGIASCKKDNIQRIVLTNDFLPLEIGNQWTYELKGRDSIVNTQTINGVLYYEIINNSASKSYFRNQDNKMFVITGSLENKEEMMLDLAANVNDTWTYGAGYVTLLSRNRTITIGATKIDSCLEFNFHNEHLMDYGSTIWLAPRIGIIQQTCQECFDSAYVIMKLKSAIINNQALIYK